MGRRACSLLLAVVLFLTALPQAALAISLPTLVPVANPDAYTASSDAAALPLAPPAPGVLANDSGSALTALLVTPPTHAASFSLNSNGSFSYTPTLNYVGPDSFLYKANNGHADSVVATVTITVSHGNLPPVLTVPGAQSAVQGIPFPFSTGAGNAIGVTDPDAGTNPLVVTLGASHGTLSVGTAGVTVTGNGTGSVQVTGPQASITTALNGMTYTAAAAYTGPDSLTVHADDQGNTGAGGAKTADASVALTVTSVPIVTSTTPTNGATAVLASTTVTVTFNKSVTVTATAFKLECPVGTPVPFTVTPASPATAFVLHPTSALPAGAVCTVTAVAAQISDATNSSHPTADDLFSFTVDNPLTVSSTSPTGGATAVLTSTTVTVTFNKAVNVSASAFKLECPVGTPQTFTVTPSPPGGATTFTLTPSANLPAGVVCTLTVVAAQVSDLAGTPMTTDDIVTFTTDTAPTVTSTSPVNAATTVALNSTVAFTFNKAVNVSASAFKLECPVGTPQSFTLAPSPPGGATTFTLTPSALMPVAPSSSYVLHPTSSLPVATTCTVTALAAQITDGVGTHLAAAFTASFTVDTPPTVTSTTPTNGATNVATTSTVTLTFNTSVATTGTPFKLECPTGTAKAFTVTPASPATSYVLHPTSALPGGVICTVTAVATQITDNATGINMVTDFTASFTVNTLPTVSSTTPANGATVVLPSATVTVTFSEAVNVTASAFTLECPTGTPVAFSLAPAPPGGATTFTLTPSANLPSDTVCTVTVVATQTADLIGTPLAADDVFSFATPPLAVNDTYAETAIGNVSVNSAAIPYSVTTNDTIHLTVTITAFDATSAHGGTVTMTTSGANLGQFTYNPAAGYTGADSFTYTISNAHGSTTGTVSLTISGIIWFINNNAGAGDGRIGTPFNSLAAFQAINDGVGNHPSANANIFLYDSATAYTGPVTLLNGQKLIGQDATSTLSAITGLTPGVSSATLPSTGGGSPNKVSVTSAGNTVTLGSGNTVWGMTLGNATGTALTGASVGSLKVRDLTVNNTTGAAISLASGALDAIVRSVSAGGGTHGLSLTTTTGSFDVEGDGASDPANTTQGRTTAKNGGGR